MSEQKPKELEKKWGPLVLAFALGMVVSLIFSGVSYTEPTGLVSSKDLAYSSGYHDAKATCDTTAEELAKHITCDYSGNSSCDFKFVRCVANYRVGE